MTNFEKMTQSPKAFARFLAEQQKGSSTTPWCDDDSDCSGAGDFFECTDKMRDSCMVRWLNREAPEPTAQERLDYINTELEKRLNK